MLFGKQQAQRRFWTFFETATCLALGINYFKYERFMETICSKYTINFDIIGKTVFVLLKFLCVALCSS